MRILPCGGRKQFFTPKKPEIMPKKTIMDKYFPKRGYSVWQFYLFIFFFPEWQFSFGSLPTYARTCRGHTWHGQNVQKKEVINIFLNGDILSGNFFFSLSGSFHLGVCQPTPGRVVGTPGTDNMCKKRSDKYFPKWGHSERQFYFSYFIFS